MEDVDLELDIEKDRIIRFIDRLITEQNNRLVEDLQYEDLLYEYKEEDKTKVQLRREKIIKKLRNISDMVKHFN
jgi:hypothetical protein